MSIEAALECIIELGFYRGSSTNEIARRAGVTWGVIQHYFGTREGLMLAVLQSGTEHLERIVAEAHIDGESAKDRLAQLVDVLVTHYARPEYLASLQVLLNLEHDPRTSEEVRETMRGASERSQENINRLLHEALGPKSSLRTWRAPSSSPFGASGSASSSPSRWPTAPHGDLERVWRANGRCWSRFSRPTSSRTPERGR